MSPRGRSATTLAVLAGLLVVASLWGWSAVTEPFPEIEEPPPCSDAEVSTGDTVVPEQVLVNVFNGSRRQGLAGATMNQLVERGFAAGRTGNADLVKGGGSTVQIWSDDPRNPAVRLVARQFPSARIVEGEATEDGIVVVMGDDFTRLTRPVRSMRVRGEHTFCSATGSEGP